MNSCSFGRCGTPQETKSAGSAIAWRAATRMRNRIVHGYWDLDVETLVATAGDDLPQMIVQLDHLIAVLDEDHADHQA